MKSLNKEDFLNLCFIIKKLDFTETAIEDQRDYMTFAIADCIQYSADSGSIFYKITDDLVKYIFKSFGIEENFLTDEDYEMFYNLCRPGYEKRVDSIYSELIKRSERKSLRKFLFKDGKITDLIYLPPEKLYEQYEEFTVHKCNEKPFPYANFILLYQDEVEEFKDMKLEGEK